MEVENLTGKATAMKEISQTALSKVTAAFISKISFSWASSNQTKLVERELSKSTRKG